MTAFQAEIYAILACVHEIQCQNRPEKYVSKCCDRRLWKLSRPSEQSPYWFDSAKRCWMISVPGVRWGCSGSPEILGYEVMRSPTSSQGTAMFSGLWDLSRAWESLDRIHEEELDVGWTISIRHGGEILMTSKDRLENQFRDLVWVSELGFCPLTG